MKLNLVIILIILMTSCDRRSKLKVDRDNGGISGVSRGKWGCKSNALKGSPETIAASEN